MLITVTLFPWEHESFTKLIDDGVLPQPSMHFVTGPVHLGKEGEDEIINDVYFHTFDVDNTNEDLAKFFEAIAQFINERLSNEYITSTQENNKRKIAKNFIYVAKYCRFMWIDKDIDVDEIINFNIVSFDSALSTYLMLAIKRDKNKAADTENKQ